MRSTFGVWINDRFSAGIGSFAVHGSLFAVRREVYFRTLCLNEIRANRNDSLTAPPNAKR